MFVGLDKYGKYKIYKSEESMIQKKDLFEMCIFDISTDLKGPVHTLVRSKDIKEFPLSMKIEIKVEYTDADIPFTKEKNWTLCYDINNHSDLYRIASMCSEYEVFNYFQEDNVDTTGLLMISEIKIFYPNSKIHKEEVFHYYYDIPCSFLRKFLEKHYMKLSSSKILNNQFLVLKEGEYTIEKEIPNSFDYIGIPIIGTNSFYLLSYRKYIRLKRIVSVDITLGDLEYSKRTFQDEFHPYTFFTTCSFSVLIMALLCIPQYILIQTSMRPVYGEFSFELDDGLEINITANSEDTLKGISLFKIIQQITKI